MPKLHSSRQIVRTLEKYSFIFISQRGSHAKFRKGNLTVIVPMDKREIPMGTFNSILRQSQLKKDNFG